MVSALELQTGGSPGLLTARLTEFDELLIFYLTKHKVGHGRGKYLPSISAFHTGVYRHIHKYKCAYTICKHTHMQSSMWTT